LQVRVLPGEPKFRKGPVPKAWVFLFANFPLAGLEARTPPTE
jgi:hypothetical protein